MVKTSEIGTDAIQRRHGALRATVELLVDQLEKHKLLSGDELEDHREDLSLVKVPHCRGALFDLDIKPPHLRHILCQFYMFLRGMVHFKFHVTHQKLRAFFVAFTLTDSESCGQLIAELEFLKRIKQICLDQILYLIIFT